MFKVLKIFILLTVCDIKNRLQVERQIINPVRNMCLGAREA
jgi:hypothetical protein